MSYPDPDENGFAAPQPATMRRSRHDKRRAVETPAPRRLGTASITIGAAIVSGLYTAYGITVFIQRWSAYPDPLPALLAWLILVATLVTTVTLSRVFGDRLPDWLYAFFLGGLASAVALDLYAIWPLHDIGRYASASVTAGMTMVVIITLRRSVEVLIPVVVLGLVLATAMVVNTGHDLSDAAQEITTLVFAVLPTVIALVIVGGYRHLMQTELDRVLVQSTVSAPRFAVGMMASEELARLDLAAEELLDSVATGATRLPLSPAMASTAASLATELRLHLIEDRRETWLYHAIAESDLLGKSMTLSDAGSLAGLLDPRQRDGLLSTVWLLLSDAPTSGTGRTVTVTIGPAADSVATPEGRKISVPIVLTSTGVRRNRVDPATWEAIRKVGSYSDSSQNGSLRLDIHCLVDNPAEP